MRILVVEDDAHLADVLRRGLASEGHVVDVESNGADGLMTGVEGAYDVIVLDIMLPLLNGYDVLKQLRRHRVTTPVLMLTAKDGEYDQEILARKTGIFNEFARLSETASRAPDAFDISEVELARQVVASERERILSGIRA